MGANYKQVIARVRGPGEAYEDFPLELQYGDLWRGTLPASRMVAPTAARRANAARGTNMKMGIGICFFT